MPMASMSAASFHIGELPIHGDLILAPMDGISDPPFRALTRRLGSAISISEFINCLEFNTRKHTHAHRYTFEPSERPIAVQLLDHDPVRMAEVARRIDDLVQPDFFDVNLGCCMSSITARGAGAALMRTPQVIAEIFAQLSKAVQVPLTAKMRLGWDEDSLNYLEVGRLLQECGAQMVALHARTARMAFRGQARWQPIGELKAALSIPVIGNGDVLTPADARRMRALTSCDAVMIGRGAVTNPWIFARRERADVTPGEVHTFMLKQLDAMLISYHKGALQAFRKFVKPLLEPYNLSREALHSLVTCDEVGEFKARLAGVFEGMDGVPFP
jgi:tRNA-dihydrouridine synthase B